MKKKKTRKTKQNNLLNMDAFSEAIYPTKPRVDIFDIDFVQNELNKFRPEKHKDKVKISLPRQCKTSYTYREPPPPTYSTFQKKSEQENYVYLSVTCMGDTKRVDYVHPKYNIPPLPQKLNSTRKMRASSNIKQYDVIATSRSRTKTEEDPYERLFVSSVIPSATSARSRDYRFDYECDIPENTINSDDIHSFLKYGNKTIPLQASLKPN